VTSAGRKSGSISARLDRGDDPRDVYRFWVPGGKAASIALQPGDGNVDLALWGPKTTSVLEGGQARKGDVRGHSERSGLKRERLRVRNTNRKGAYFYAEASYAAGNANASRHPAGIGYLLSATIVNPKTPARH
jgi:hypothetical protein